MRNLDRGHVRNHILVAAPRSRYSIIGAVSVALTGLVACNSGSSGSNDMALSSPVSQLPLVQACPAYSAKSLPHGAKVTKTEVRKASETLPEVCIVRGEIVSSPTSTINWSVELPSNVDWNGKTVTIGGGGFDGFIPTDSPYYQQMIGPSANPFVKISTDSGHQTTNFYPWATDDVALRNHAFEANHQVLEVGTAIATEFYGKKPTRRYSFGQSNGGRSGLVAAQRYPNDYDGVIALEPAISQQGHEANVGPEIMTHIFKRPENWLSPAKVKLFAEAELKACDELDGLKDGVIGNVTACQYIPTDLECKGADSDSCLTVGQIETIRRVYSDHRVPVQLADGIVGYPRFGRGGAATSDWGAYLFGSSFEARDPFNYMVGDQAAKVVTNDSSVSLMTYDPTRYQAQWTRLSTLIDATNPDLTAFASRGGKMLIWYGVSDTCVSIYRTAEYFDNVRKKLGDTATKGFARFLTTPGVGHNLDGPGAGKIDFIAALDAWVEKNQAPDQLVGAHYEEGSSTPTNTRPVCEYPKFPRYNGTGDATKAENFTCSVS